MWCSTAAGCEPVLFYLFQRHTTRYPDRKAIEEASVTLQRLAKEITSQEKSRLCKQDLHDLSKWLFPFVPDQDNMIAPEGILVTEAQGYKFSKKTLVFLHSASGKAAIRRSQIC